MDAPAKPEPADYDGMLLEVVEEVRSNLTTPQWALNPNERMIVAAHAAAGLAHACELAEALVRAHAEDNEMLGRLIARALYETWLVSYYIQLGEKTALEAIVADFINSRKTAVDAIKKEDERLRKAAKIARRRNRNIEQQNNHYAKWNADHPDQPPKEMVDSVTVPRPLPKEAIPDITRDTLPKVPPPAKLPLIKVVERLGPLTREAGFEETYEASYHLAYRSLSTYGAHTSLFVLQSYLDNPGRHSNFLRVLPHAQVSSSFSEANRSLALLLVSALATAVFESRDQECPKAKAAFELLYDVFGDESSQQT